MKIRVLAVLVSLAVLILQLPVRAGQRAVDEPLFRVRIVVANVAEVKASLEISGYDVLETSSVDSAIELVVSASELRALESSGFSVVTIEQSRPFQSGPQAKAGSAAATVPGAATAAVPALYQNLNGVLARMQAIADAYPAIARFVDLTVEYQTPPTFDGRHMFALKISDNVNVDEDEPAMLIVGTHHAREINVPVIGLEAANNLTSKYSTDSQIAAAVNGNEIWIAPVWNPDGYNWVFTVNNMWRKNRRPLTGAVGVDQNRNYPQGWSTSCAGSTSPASDTYKGPSPASEPETQTMMAWSRAERFAKVIDYHSSGREVLFAYRCLSHPFSSWMEQEAAALSEASGYGGLTREPSAEGEHYEWQLAQMGAYAFLIETGTEFQPPYESALAEAALVWPGILKVLERPISMSGHVTDLATGAPLPAKIEILNVAFTQGETNFSGGPRGTYHMFVPPGTYDVRFSAPGYSPVVSQVTVTASSSTVREIQLSPELVVFSDDFETNKGWTTNPNGTDTAITGQWERGDPETTNSAGTKQLGTTVSGTNDLVTGRLAGATASSFDIDNGSTSIQSPPIALPSGGNLTLTFSYYLAHTSTSSSADYLRVTIVGATTAVVLQELGAANNDDAAWSAASVNLSAFAGQTIRIRVDAADSAASIVEAGIDDVRVTRANDGPVAVDDTATVAENTTATIAVLANDSDPNGDTLTVTATTQGAHGAVTLVSGVVRYAPAPDYVGPDSFTYTIRDSTGVTDTGTVTVTVTPVNAAPVAVNDTATVSEDSAGTNGNVLDNDTDVDTGTTLTATLAASPVNGTVTLAANGTFTYTPAPDFNGTDSFTYTASDGTAVSNVATVTIAVTAVNDAPIAINDTASTTEETAVSGAVLGNDLDVEPGTTLTATLDAGPANGTVTLAANGTFTYTPALNFSGTDSFTYTASDGAAVSNVATVTIAVTGVNDAPVAANDTASTPEETAVSGNVLGNDTDVDTGTTLTAALGASPAHGAVTVNANGSFTYTPNLNFNGTDSFTYAASDGTAVSNVATVTITVTAVNDAPVAVNDTATVSEDSAGTNGNVLGNDTDVDTGTTLTATLAESPVNGTVTLAANGTFTYTPAPDFNGTDSFTYTASDGTAVSNVATVTIAVTAVNDAPMAVHDTASTTEETAVSGAVLGNDLDVEPGTTLTATLDAGPANGTVTLAANGTFTYTPAANFSGTDSFTYTASDGAAVSNVATVTIAVTGVNDAPVAANDTASTPEDAAVSGTVLGNDTDVDTGTTLTATLGASPAHGAVTLNADGSFTYTPAANFSGTDSFTYTASDGTAVSNVATATITVTAVNDAPVAVNDTATVSEDSAGTNGNVLGNDTDVDTGTTLTATLGASPSNGTVTLAANGTFTYTPAPDFNGTDSFTYTASDGTAVSNVATVTIAVTAVNDAPIAINDTASTMEETAVSGAVLGNDLDIEPGTTLTATLDAGPANGTVTLAANGTFTYTPAVNFSGTDSFTYTASDGAAVSNVATVTITVTGVNDAPVAVNDTASTPEDAAVSGTVLGNDTDVDTGTTLTATLGASPSNGTVTLAANGTFTYTPAANFSGTDSFTYTASDGAAVSSVATVTITVTAVNDAPVAVNDSATVSEDSAGTNGNVLGNDTDVDTGTTLTATLGASPVNGTVTLAANGTFTYTPAPDFNGTDSFTYTASDGTAVSNVATVTIAVTAVNDAPIAINDTASTMEETAVSGAVLGNDLDIEPGTTLTATLDAGPANGTVTLAANGTFTYTPAVNFSGTDSFTYTASDGAAVSNVATVTIAVTAVNDAPVAVNDTATVAEDSAGTNGNVLGNDTDVDAGTTLTATLGASPAHGALTLNANGTFTYTPAANFSGTDSFTYTASDGAAVSNVATVTITVTAVNDAPVAVNDTATVSEDSAGTNGNVLGNDTDVDTGTTLTATLGTSPSNGTVTLAANGTFTYTPAPDFNGTDSFTYTASDGTAVSNVATVTIAVTAVNDAPIAINDTASTMEETAVSGAVLGNDLDVEPGTTLTATLDAGPANGTVTLAANGTFTYTPAVNFSGTDSFTYTASDGAAVSNVATVTITVTGVNDAPVAINDTASTPEETAVSGTVLGNDTDVDTGTTLTATLGASPAHGAVTLNANGSFTYTPAANFSGTDSFTYTASDGTAISNVATVTITVTAVNDAPVAVNDTATVSEDSAGTNGNVLGNDTDVDTGTTLTATLAGSPVNGTVTLAANGTFTYTPAPDFNGTDSFTYTASDGTAVSNVATVTIAVTAVNDAPIAVHDTVSTTEETAVSGAVLGNDLDVEPGTTLTATLDAGPANGTVTLAANGSFTYTPAVNFSGTDSFTYTASDGAAVSNVATVTITVTGVNDAPVAANDTASTPEETAVSGAVLGNDTDVDTGTTLTATLGASPSNGTVTLAANGTFTYTPAANFSGTDSFTYTASDGTAVSNVATVTITVTAVNDAPVAVNDSATVSEDSAGTNGNVLGNDTDVDTGTTLTATLAGSPANGTVTLAANGTFTYTPAPDFNGTDSFTYTASDGTAVSNVATVTIAVTAVNDAPIAINDTASTMEETAVSGAVLGNDLDIETGTTLTATLDAGPANGTVTLAANGSFTYTPAVNFSGTDSFTYTASDGAAVSNVATVTITVTAVNDAPVAANDTATVSEDSAGTNGNVLGNDTDVDAGTTLTATLGASPANGTVTLAANGTFTYTPAPDFNGTDSFTYTASDGTAVSNVATVTITVTAVNDAPMAINDTASTTEETAVSGAVLGNDLDIETGTTLTATLDAGPANGTVTLAANGTFTYTPAANFSGMDSFTYTASDGAAVSNVATVTITVTAVNDAPVAVNDTATVAEDSAGTNGNVLGNDTDVDAGTTLTATLAASPAHGAVTLAANGTFTYTPAANFSGTDSFTYTASDGTAVSNVATVTITVTAVNDAPVAVNDAASTTEDAAVSGAVLGNDTDVDTGTTLTATLAASPANGTVTLAANGSFTYTPAVNFNGTDSFTYTASDGAAVSNVATVTIAVTAVNDAPVAVNDTASTTQGTAVSGTVLGNDTDVDPGTALTASLGAGPANGTVTLALNGSFTYTPAASFSGTDSFTYTASDGTAASNVATVTITVTPVGNPVVFADDFETARGWTTNPNGTDTATTGQWERGNPESTTSTGTKQLGTTVSGVNGLVTGRLAGTSVGSFDIDDGSTSIQSPAIVLPSGGNLTLTFSYYLAHLSNSSTADYLRVTIVGTTTAVVFQELGAADNDDAAWAAASVNLNAFAGQTIRIRIDAADAGSASLVEAAIDDVKIVRQ